MHARVRAHVGDPRMWARDLVLNFLFLCLCDGFRFSVLGLFGARGETSAIDGPRDRGNIRGEQLAVEIQALANTWNVLR